MTHTEITHELYNLLKKILPILRVQLEQAHLIVPSKRRVVWAISGKGIQDIWMVESKGKGTYKYKSILEEKNYL